MDRVFPPSISNGGREHEGMSLRDHFAGLAMQSLIGDGRREGSLAEYAAHAYEYADAMLKQRSLTND